MIFETGELKEEATISKMETVQQEGNREVKRMVVMYKLDAIIAVGYRVNSIRADFFRNFCHQMKNIVYLRTRIDTTIELVGDIL